METYSDDDAREVRHMVSVRQETWLALGRVRHFLEERSMREILGPDARCKPARYSMSRVLDMLVAHWLKTNGGPEVPARSVLKEKGGKKRGTDTDSGQGD